MKSFYVYIYIDPRTNLPFYIGKGSGKRAYTHLRETKETTENYLKWCKIQSLINHGISPIVKIIFESYDENECYELEAKMISELGRIGFDANGILTNRCIDNRPPTYSAKLPRSAEYKKNMSLAKMGDKNPRFGIAPWNKGKPGYSTSKKGQKRKWITDGKSSKQILRSDPIPNGWVCGRHSNGLLDIKRAPYKSD